MCLPVGARWRMTLCTIQRHAYIITLHAVRFIIAQIVQEWIVPKPTVLVDIHADIVAAKNKKVFFYFSNTTANSQWSVPTNWSNAAVAVILYPALVSIFASRRKVVGLHET